MQALNSGTIYPMRNDEPRKGRPPFWSDELGDLVPGGRDYPRPAWKMIDKKETKVTVQEMIFSQEFEEKIHRLGAEQKAKRLSAENEKTPPE